MSAVKIDGRSLTVQLPYRSESKVILPEVVRAHGNGKIPKELLQPCGIRNFTLVEPAARACRALVAASAADGIRLDATGTYRSYESQLQMFTGRYTKTPRDGEKPKTWDGVKYWKKPGVPMAAVPGTSKHGLGVTLDLAQRSPSGAFESVGPATLLWLAEHGPTYGFWNSVKSEAWHWPYFPGDDVPDAVIEMEESGKIRLQAAVPNDAERRAAFYRELPFEHVLSKGSKGSAVEAAQWALTVEGISTHIDGDFGPATERSVKTYQPTKALAVSGIVDESTWSNLGLLPDQRRPQENTVPLPAKKAKPAATAKPVGMAKPAAKTKPASPAKKAAVVTGAVAAAAAAHRAGFGPDDLADITMIAGRESRWKSDAVNPNTTDRGMWQINWKNLQRNSYDALRSRLGITTDRDLLDLEVNAAVAFQMFEDSAAFGEPWFPWRGSEKGRDGSAPGWDPKGSHTWNTEAFAAEAQSAATAVLGGEGPPAVNAPTSSSSQPATKAPRGSYVIGPDDNDGIVAVISRCVGIADESWGVRRSAAESVVQHNGTNFVAAWHPGDVILFPPTIAGVRSYTVEPSEGMLAITAGLGLAKNAAEQKRVEAINAWQGSTPHPGDTWYGGLAT